MKEFLAGLWNEAGPPALVIAAFVVFVFAVLAVVDAKGRHHDCVDRCMGSLEASDTLEAVKARRQHCEDLCEARNK